jgi:hypothetical protein
VTIFNPFKSMGSNSLRLKPAMDEPRLASPPTASGKLKEATAIAQCRAMPSGVADVPKTAKLPVAIYDLRAARIVSKNNLVAHQMP